MRPPRCPVIPKDPLANSKLTKMTFSTVSLLCFRQLIDLANIYPIDVIEGGHEVRNERALFVYNRVQNKLTGA